MAQLVYIGKLQKHDIKIQVYRTKLITSNNFKLRDIPHICSLPYDLLPHNYHCFGALFLRSVTVDYLAETIRAEIKYMLNYLYCHFILSFRLPKFNPYQSSF